ncbi:MAG: MucB/RseB C-terminal domain-containing protein [Steroidobacteraceae bacterium]|nr:MucB/RseB C-terminal domain-containing protein [Steroidobacteraceae bacterium]
MMRRTFALPALALLALPAAANDGQLWLGRMADALSGRSYAGEFVCESAGRSEKLRITHRVRDGSVSERLVSLSGGGRELVRNDDEVVVYLPDQKLAIIERRSARSDLMGALPTFNAGASPWYEVSYAGRETALLGPAAVVVVRPRDGYRFGYRLWIDEASHMPVRSELSDAAGRVIERLRFTQLAVTGDIPDAAFEPALDRTRLRWVRQAPQAGDEAPGWRAAQVPPGFRLSMSGLQAMAGASAPVRHLVYSDGLASVSVFIQPSAPGKAPVVGSGRAGVASAYTTVVHGHQVTVVGEVPPDTLRFIATGLRPAAEPPPAATVPAERRN